MGLDTFYYESAEGVSNFFCDQNIYSFFRQIIKEKSCQIGRQKERRNRQMKQSSPNQASATAVLNQNKQKLGPV